MPTSNPARGILAACGRRRGLAACHSTRGSALLMVLWMSAALAAIAFSVSSTIRSETDRVSTASDGLRAYYLASGSVERAIQWMLWGMEGGGTGYRNQDGSARFWEPNLPRMSLHFPSGEAVVEMIPEASKFNINTASSDDLFRVVQAVSGDPGRARSIADGILDWRSSSSASSFDPLYLAQGPTFRPRHASFEEIEELLLVRGVTPELFYGNFVADPEGRLYAHGGLRDCLSVWGSVGPFDINTVSPAVMEAIGIPQSSIAEILMQRSAKPFRSAAELAALGIPLTRLGVGGNVIWTLRATARLRRPDGKPSDVVRTSAAVVKLIMVQPPQYSLLPLHVLRYYDDAWSQFALTPPGGPVQ